MSLRRDWWRHPLQKGASAHFGEDEDVEEMHAAEHEHHYADFTTDCLKHSAEICGRNALSQSKRDVADIDEIKANNEQMVDRIGQLFVAVK